MQASEINSNRIYLYVEISKAILKSVNFVTKTCAKLRTIPEEPDFIASLTLNFTCSLHKILKAHFPKNKYSVTGIFCHQKPLVDIGEIKSPELGDILFIYIHSDKLGNKRHNSLLLQAKISQKEIFKISINEYHQLKLYKNWPEFKYKRAGSALNGALRSILPKTSNDGAQYLLIDNHPLNGLSGKLGTFPMGCAQPQETLHLDNDFAYEIIDFLKFKAGRIFEENPTTSNDDWTKMIWEMIDITKLKLSKRNNIGLHRFPRSIAKDYDGLHYINSETPSIFSDLVNYDGEERTKRIIDDDANGALSLIVIESIENKG